MLVKDIINQSIKNLGAQKIRSFLTMLGIVIGIFSIIVIMSSVRGAESLITNQIRSIGSNILGILPGKSDDSGPPAAVMGIIITTLTDEDTSAIAKLNHVKVASSYVTATESVYFESDKVVATIMGVSSSYPRISDSEISEGRFFTEDEKLSNANVAVIGSQVKDDLFHDTNPIGLSIKIKQNRFRIIGILDSVGVSGFQNLDNVVFVPVSTAQKRLIGINHIGFMRVRVDDEKNIKYVEREIEDLLRVRHNIKYPQNDDFSIRTTAQAFESLEKITKSLQIFLLAIVGISLIVGGIGIMNIMLASVGQRVKEIGLRKSVGARRSHIISQFLIETIAIVFFGAIIGIIFGALFSVIIAKVVNSLGYDWSLIVSPISILIACASSIIIGIIFGLYPALKAAKLDPISALRYE